MQRKTKTVLWGDCVRVGMACALLVAGCGLKSDSPGVNHAQRYKIQPDGSILDTKTKLIWQEDKDFMKSTHSPQGRESLPEAQEICAQLAPQGQWRLPTPEDFKKVVEKDAPDQLHTRLPQTRKDDYWTSLGDLFNLADPEFRQQCKCRVTNVRCVRAL